MKIQTFARIALVLILLTIITIPVMAAQPGALPAQEANPTVPEAVLLLIPILVGSLGVPVVNWLKKTLGWTAASDKVKNIWLTFGVAVALAVLALLITQSFAPIGGPETLVTWLGLIFTVATLIYKSMQPTPENQNRG